MPRTKKKNTKKVEEKLEKKPEKKSVYAAIGRRKTAVARVRLMNEKGILLINQKPVGEYFPGEVAKIAYSEPMRTTNTCGKLSGTILVEGGGKNAQLQAVILGISRALVSLNEQFRPILRKRGFLTRDPRAKERKKPGFVGARKKKQSPKR